MTPGTLSTFWYFRDHQTTTPITLFYLADETGKTLAYRGFALTRDLDRAKQEFENQMGHKGAIEARSLGL